MRKYHHQGEIMKGQDAIQGPNELEKQGARKDERKRGGQNIKKMMMTEGPNSIQR